jgi:hypothetical protein
MDAEISPIRRLLEATLLLRPNEKRGDDQGRNSCSYRWRERGKDRERERDTERTHLACCIVLWTHRME